MTLWLALAGWALAGALALRCARRGRRLELVARADHELRGPVCALGLAVEALARNPELRRRAAALDAHLDRLRLGLADLGAAREGRRAVARADDVRIDGVARAATAAWEPAVRAGGGEISFDWRAGPAVAHADPARLSQALGNLLANASSTAASGSTWWASARVTAFGSPSATAVVLAVRASRPCAGAGEAWPSPSGRWLRPAAR